MDSSNYTSIPGGLIAHGFKLVPRGDPRRIKEFGTWEKEGVRVALSSNHLQVESGAVIVYQSDGGEMVLETLVTDSSDRRKGKGAAALHLVVMLADQVGTRLQLEPVPLEKNAGMSRAQLSLFYKAAGFSPVDPSGLLMERLPRQTPSVHIEPLAQKIARPALRPK